MSHRHLERFSLTTLEQHYVAEPPTNMTSFGLKTPSLVMPWDVRYVKDGTFLVDALCASRVYSKVG